MLYLELQIDDCHGMSLKKVEMAIVILLLYRHV